MHARLSPSAAHRWLNCIASLKLNQGYEEVESDYAKEGTVAHALAADCLLHNKDLGHEDIIVDGVEIDGEMRNAIMEYVNVVRALSANKTLVVEEKIDLSHVVKDCWGTADAVIYDDKTIEVHDLKFGRGKQVKAQNNEQLLIYLLGAVDKYMLVEPPTSMKVFIHQPRNGGTTEWEVSAEELSDFCNVLIDKATKAIEYADNDIEPNEPLYCVEDKTCMFCKAKKLCKARADKILEAIGLSFDDLTAPKKDVGLLTNEELAQLLPLAKEIEEFGASLLSTARDKILVGQKIKGYKLVAGKKGIRKWTEEESVLQLFKRLRLRDNEIYEKTLISPTTAEKLLKTSKEKWEKVKAFIQQAEGKPTVVEESDPREAITLNFNVIIDDLL